MKILKGSPYDVEQLAASIVAAKIEFSRIGIEDPGDIVSAAEGKLYELTFGPLREFLEFSRDSRVRSELMIIIFSLGTWEIARYLSFSINRSLF